MSEPPATAPAPPPDWTEVQRRCLAAWTALAGDTSAEARLPVQGAGLLRFAAATVQLLQALDEARRGGGELDPVLRRELHALGESLPGVQAPDAASGQTIEALWGPLLEAWQQVLAAVPRDQEETNAGPDASRGEYAQASLAYSALLHDSSRRALDLLAAELSRRLAAGGELSLRGLYNLWVDCGEQAYAEMLDQSRYSHAYGRLVNALLRSLEPATRS